MNTFIFSILASCCAAFSNLLFRKNSQLSQDFSNTNNYLIYYYLISFLLSFLLFPNVLNGNLNCVMLGIGACVGILNVFLMFLISRALQQGPAGLTYAFQNTSAVFPGMLLFLLFGSEYGFTYSYQQLVGILLVVYGLFLGARNEANTQSASTSKWLKYAIVCLTIQILALTLIQARCVLFDLNPSEVHSSLCPFASNNDVSFMLGQFGTAFSIQILYLLYKKRSLDANKGMLFGTLGGLTNFVGTFLLLLATKWALPFEKALLFPCFAVATIILCKVWAKYLYEEKFNLVSNVTCASGILLGLIPF